MRRFSTAVTITDPLVKYKSLVSTGIYAPDTAQHRLAHHLQKVYSRIKDYTPQTEYRERLNQVARLTERKIPEEDEDGRGVLALKHHSIWRNPLFKHLLPTPEGRDSLALTRVLSSYETAIEIDSPKGLFLSGEVGTGKSMLLDLLADGLPTERKRRWHFNTFMLYAFSQLETHRRSQPYSAAPTTAADADYSLLWLAKKLVDESPILFLDEFQLPDRAASKILSHLFIAFFQLGGVLIASSNRMPEELQKATGLDYAPAPAKGLIRRMFGTAGLAQKGELFGQSSDFANFLEVLKARCDFWQMEGATDWRRREEVEADQVDQEMTTTVDDSMAIGGVSPSGERAESAKDVAKRPRQYLLPSDEPNDWIQRVKAAASWTGQGPVPWEPVDLVVYGRKVHTPQSYQGCVYWDFGKLVESFGPADYITMASSYHTFIIDNIPVLTLSMKNEARRFITLLDALYEARCKLLIRAKSTPDHLFFPSKKTASPSGQVSDGDDDATYSETIAEVYQDQMAPFRPNVSFYDTANPTSTYDPDQDSDFGLQQQLQRPQPAIDFGNTGAFTGEDERFAYKRGVSRLWELCSAQWHARTGDWWRPLPIEARHWEGGEASKRVEWKPGFGASADSGEGMGESVDIEEPAGLSKWRIEWLKKKEE
ncbi:AFG1-like ATPase domain-containing protein [Sarocladium implicatum]|nr:AFG1-like ATPase domain-containing protein [Sarocladium implicatum]